MSSPTSPVVVISAPFTMSSSTKTIPPDARPPRYGYRSTSVTRAPLRAAATAALTPAGPPPTTRTSVASTTGVARATSAIVAGVAIRPTLRASRSRCAAPRS